MLIAPLDDQPIVQLAALDSLAIFAGHDVAAKEGIDRADTPARVAHWKRRAAQR